MYAIQFAISQVVLNKNELDNFLDKSTYVYCQQFKLCDVKSEVPKIPISQSCLL